MTAIVGTSGSGKSSLLYCIAGLLRPTAGRIEIDGTDVYGLSAARRAAFRGQKVGFVFQSFHLFPQLDVLQNVMAGGGRFDNDASRAQSTLERIGLAERMHHLPSQLSVPEYYHLAP